MSAGAALLEAGKRLLAGPWQMRLTPPAPRAGLEVSASGLHSRMRVRGGATDARLPLPSAVARLDGLHPNAADEKILAAELEPMLSGLPAGPLALLLPTRYFRAFTLDLEGLPRRASELDLILRFRLKRLLPYKPEAARLAVRLISPQPARLFVLAGYEPVLRQWESALAACRRPAGWLLPATLAGLAARPAAAESGIELLIDGDDDGVNLLATQSGMPLLLRSKTRLSGESAAALACREAALTAAYLRDRLHLPKLTAAAARGLEAGADSAAESLAGTLQGFGCETLESAPEPLDWIAPDPARAMVAA